MPGVFMNPLARGAAVRMDEDDVDRWLADDVERDAVKAHIRWWRSWRAVGDGLRAEAELRKILSGARSPYDALSVLAEAEEELKTMENILAELEILIGKIEQANGRYAPVVGEPIGTTRPGAERFKM